MSLPLLHAGKSAPGLSAALDLRFALDKSLTAYRGPTPSFSRASTGSYFDGSGVLRYANVNLLTYSEQFDNAVWIKGNSSISANTILSPDGNTTADKLVENSSNTVHQLYQAKTLTAASYTFSAYMKAGGRTWAAFNITPGTDTWTFFDLSNGVVGTVGSGHTASITPAGNGWYRCAVTFTGTAVLWYLIAAASTGNNVASYTGDGSSGIYIWGAQLEASSTVGTYCPTTSSANSAPRFDHTFNGTSWVSRGLLVEEQRTNLWLQSNSLNTSPWTQYQNTSTENAANSPDGTSNASSVVPNTSNLAHYTYQLVTTSAISYSISFYAKKNGYDFVQLSTGISTDYVNFNLNTGSVGNKSGGIYSSAKIESVGNGWYRCSVTIASIAGNYDHGITVINADTASRRPAFAGDGTSGILLYGFQMEAGSFATSLIPTTTASTTRSADVCQITGTDFSGFWNGTEGSFAVEYDSASPQGFTGAYPVVTFSDSATNTQRIWYSGEGGLGGNRFYVDDPASGLSTTLIATPISGGSVSTKASCAFKQNDIAFSYNGGTPYTGASQIIPSGINILRLGQNPASGNQFCGHIARLRYFNKRLPNATLQQLST